MNPKTLCDQYTKEQLAEKIVKLEIKVAEQSQQRTQALGKLEDATKCDLCDDQAEYRQCQQCMNDKLIGSHTDEKWRLLFSENAELKKYLKHARDDKKIRLGEIEGLEAKIVEKVTELDEILAQAKLDHSAQERVHELEAENAELSEALIELLRSNGCFGDYGVEIPEELSARLDIGLDLAHYIVDILTPKETSNENPPI